MDMLREDTSGVVATSDCGRHRRSRLKHGKALGKCGVSQFHVERGKGVHRRICLWGGYGTRHLHRIVCAQTMAGAVTSGGDHDRFVDGDGSEDRVGMGIAVVVELECAHENGRIGRRQLAGSRFPPQRGRNLRSGDGGDHEGTRNGPDSFVANLRNVELYQR